MTQKEELLSNLMFPEDQGNCRLQTGAITWILKGKWNALVLLNELSKKLSFTYLIIASMEFSNWSKLRISKYAFLNVIKNTTISYVSILKHSFRLRRPR